MRRATRRGADRHSRRRARRHGGRSDSRRGCRLANALRRAACPAGEPGNGEFVFTQTAGAAALFVHALGYHDTVIAFARDTFIVVVLTPNPLQKSGVTVTAERYASAIADVPVSTAVMESDNIQLRDPETLTTRCATSPALRCRIIR